ncbi:hypothetical protein C7S18_19230 [Ahniella affigens]|uniref:Uncharacterized protein n=2 Tax=Ahniella affigens TaxID=2021234 RepID=A0A2P1PWE0_9GAMM|nr:hypothetical protein C7S18_19230 [Ahniella affigens]
MRRDFGKVVLIARDPVSRMIKVFGYIIVRVNNVVLQIDDLGCLAIVTGFIISVTAEFVIRIGQVTKDKGQPLIKVEQITTFGNRPVQRCIGRLVFR